MKIQETLCRHKLSGKARAVEAASNTAEGQVSKEAHRLPCL